MPIMIREMDITGLLLKPPITLRMSIPKSVLENAKAKLGTRIDTATVVGARWGLVVKVCPEDNPECETPARAFEATFNVDQPMGKWFVELILHEYYVTPSAKLQYFVGGLDMKLEDTNIDLVLSDSLVSLVYKGQTLVSTDMLKKYGSIRALSSMNYLFTTGGVPISNGRDVAIYNLEIVRQLDVTGIATPVLTIAISLAVVGLVVAMMKYVIPKVRG